MMHPAMHLGLSSRILHLRGVLRRHTLLSHLSNTCVWISFAFTFRLHRVSVGSSDENVLGTCLLCSSSFDDYSSRSRGTYCRMLVLVCGSCQEKDSLYVCELCQKYGNSVASIPAFYGEKCRTSRKLRILCLHGFRQNASSFKGRSASLAKKLKNMAELVFVDAPHELQFIYQPEPTDPNLRDTSSATEPVPPKSCNKKFAWLVAPNFSGESGTDWKIADGPFDSLQYQQQAEGFDESLAYLKTIFSQAGPFYGILGFSQGAAMAASLAARKERLKGEMDIRFVILCSGFTINLMKNEQELINCPSLHIFGDDRGKDRQISSNTSRDLASLFEEGCSVIIEHEYGHIIPTRSPYIDEIKEFLQRFLQSE